MVKNLPANVGDVSLTLGWEDPLEKEIATHSSILAWTEKLGGLESMGSQRVRQDSATKHSFKLITMETVFYAMLWKSLNL